MDSISVICYDLKFIENPLFKLKLLRQYIHNLCKLDYPFAQIIYKSIIKDIEISSLEIFAAQFNTLNTFQFNEIFSSFPEIQPELLFFITKEINGEIVYFNKAMYTDILFENRQADGAGYIDFLAFNKIVERVFLNQITSIDLNL